MKDRLQYSVIGLVFALLFVGLGGAPAAAAGPFLEPDVEVIYSFSGDQVGDGFGWVAANLEDITGDGVTDFAIPAPFYQVDGIIHGKVNLYSGADGSLIRTILGRPYDQFGYSVRTAGDVDADGVPDYVIGGIGAPDAPEPFLGRAAVFSGSDHSLLHEFTGTPGARFGYGVSAAGDVNGDGYGDILVGAPTASFSAPLAGRIYLYSGYDGEELWHMDGDADQDFLGGGVGLVGLVNEDQVPDVVASGWGAGPSGGGEAYVLSGDSGERLLTLRPHAIGEALRFGQFFTTGAGDVNADGTPDIFIGDYAERKGQDIVSGRAYVFSGATGKELLRFGPEERADGIGPGRAVGDVDGDGHADLIIAAYLSDAGGPDAGRAYLHSGRDGALIRTFTGTVPFDNLGVDALAVGDVNGDGATDYLLTAVGLAFAQLEPGHAYVVAGRP